MTRTCRRLALLALGAGLAVSVPASLTAQITVVQGAAGSRLDSIFTAAESRGFHGAVLVAQRGEVLLAKGYGIANHASGLGFGPSTLVQIGSNVKDFTKVAIYQLVEQGRLRLTDSLGGLIPSLRADKRGITVGQLLNHTSGLPLGAGGGDVYPLTRAEMVRRLDTIPLGAAPGTREVYSNLGYALLAYIIEQLSGQSYDAYVAQHILAPLGLRDTGSYLPGFDRARIAHGYQGDRDIGIILDMPHDSSGHLWALRGNGGYLSTLGDMWHFYQALGGTALLRDPAHRRAVLDPDHPAVLAGSDLTSFFLFANYPGADAEVFIATNHGAFRGSRMLPEVEAALGIQRGGTGGPRAVTAPALERLPDNGVGRTIGAYLDAYNSGDTAAVRRFFTEQAVSGPNTPPMETRLGRYREMYGNLGRMTFRSIRQSPDGQGWAVSVLTAGGDPVTLTFLLEDAAPNRVMGIRVEVGN